MARYIDADDIDNITVFLDSKGCLKRIEAPTADVAPVVHAHWDRKAYFPDGTPAWVCSRCGHPEEVKYSHCNCGARMDEEVNNETQSNS